MQTDIPPRTSLSALVAKKNVGADIEIFTLTKNVRHMDSVPPRRGELARVLHRGAHVITIIAALCVYLYRGDAPQRGDATMSGGRRDTQDALEEFRIPMQIHDSHRNREEWFLVNSIGGIETYKRHTKLKNMHSFLGNTTVPIHISQLLAPFVNISLAPDWIDMLKTLIQLDCAGASCGNDPNKTSVVYQLFDSPWPVSDRDLVLRRSWDADQLTRTVTVDFVSIEDPRLPEVDGIVRAISPLTRWTFRQQHMASGRGMISRTYIEVQSTVDIRGSVPSYLYNYLQSRYAHKIISNLIHIASRNVTLPLHQFTSW
jgi:hypothetical protein